MDSAFLHNLEAFSGKNFAQGILNRTFNSPIGDVFVDAGGERFDAPAVLTFNDVRKVRRLIFGREVNDPPFIDEREGEVFLFWVDFQTPFGVHARSLL